MQRPIHCYGRLTRLTTSNDKLPLSCPCGNSTIHRLQSRLHRFMNRVSSNWSGRRHSAMRGPAQVRRSDVQSAWSGLRPLALDPRARDTASASRDHVVVTDPDGLITVTGAPAGGAADRAGHGLLLTRRPGLALRFHGAPWGPSWRHVAR